MDEKTVGDFVFSIKVNISRHDFEKISMLFAVVYISESEDARFSFVPGIFA
jgi:hypothetical protein